MTMTARANQVGHPAAVVVGGSLGGLGAVRSLGAAGIPVIAVAHRHSDVSLASRYATAGVATELDGEPLIDALLKLRGATPHGAALIFSSDTPLLTVSRRRDELAGHYRFRLPPHDLLVRLLAKEAFHAVAAAHGFPVPKTLTVRGEADLAQLDGLVPPLAVKQNRRSAAYDALFDKAHRTSSVDEARALCRRMLQVIDAVVVQEWIEGDNDAIHFTLQYIGQAGTVSFTGRKLRSWPRQVGLTASCTAAEDAAAELVPLTTRFFQAAGITCGLVSMEYKRDCRSGRFLMVEPTIARANWQAEIATLCGVNLPLAAYRDALGLPLPEARLDPGHVWRNELVDHAAAWASHEPYRLPPGRRVHNAYWRWTDPQPALVYLRRKAAGLLRRGMEG